ncbi:MULTISPECIES: YegS/Rv2252/BmrU family lipid kinase [Bacillus amyloliquefaciens group]|uniref:YegS/Rv2252/BmrU family lipid kinase n=1 Tax=Bacillus amyloliquefaciens group TaxID=1938374 RepID=UPI001F4CCD5E|nr:MULTISPECIES: YegS/Rv2252/BmrU family lipid kinase [Bacillus amyloliquefaciens group]MCM3446908.1 YegS/Rv2252/BmrU family lipid kinase [Bacillus velezensis]UNE51689.1 YegS/Rv2252/BmrU family lipid kinase [Bacillus amyloliquefaciens]
MSQRKAVLIYNGNAGQKQIDKTLGTVVPILAQSADELLIKPTKHQDDARQYCENLDSSVDHLYILGGDGTVHQCINSISKLDHRPAVGILPGGTCNDFSRALGIPQNLQKAAEVLAAGHKRMIDVCKTDDGYFLNFWGIGLITEASSHINETEKAWLGKISYFTSALRTMTSANPFPVKLTIDGEVKEDEAVMVLVMNGHYIGTNRVPLPDASLQDGLADVLICRNTSLAALRELMTMEQGSFDDFKGELSYIQASRIEIETAREMDADTDGEVYGTTPCTIEVKKHHLTMLVPEDSQ